MCRSLWCLESTTTPFTVPGVACRICVHGSMPVHDSHRELEGEAPQCPSLRGLPCTGSAACLPGPAAQSEANPTAPPQPPSWAHVHPKQGSQSVTCNGCVQSRGEGRGGEGVGNLGDGKAERPAGGLLARLCGGCAHYIVCAQEEGAPVRRMCALHGVHRARGRACAVGARTTWCAPRKRARLCGGCAHYIVCTEEEGAPVRWVCALRSVHRARGRATTHRSPACRRPPASTRRRGRVHRTPRGGSTLPHSPCKGFQCSLWHTVGPSC
jgi:hypothetical protein